MESLDAAGYCTQMHELGLADMPSLLTTALLRSPAVKCDDSQGSLHFWQPCHVQTKCNLLLSDSLDIMYTSSNECKQVDHKLTSCISMLHAWELVYSGFTDQVCREPKLAVKRSMRLTGCCSTSFSICGVCPQHATECRTHIHGVYTLCDQSG